MDLREFTKRYAVPSVLHVACTGREPQGELSLTNQGGRAERASRIHTNHRRDAVPRTLPPCWLCALVGCALMTAVALHSDHPHALNHPRQLHD